MVFAEKGAKGGKKIPKKDERKKKACYNEFNYIGKKKKTIQEAIKMSDKKLRLVDSHTHSNCSFDGHFTHKEMAEAAKKANVAILAITDHCDLVCVDCEMNERNKQDIYRSFEKTKKVQVDGVKMLAGIELGQYLHRKETAQEILAEKEWDFVLGSLHNTYENEDPYFVNFFTWEDSEAQIFYENYLRELLWAAREADYDSLAHITYPVRYIVGDYEKELVEDRLFGLYRQILETVIERDKSLEINTGGIRKKIGLPSPDEELIRFYYSIGGRKITVGSDAHYTEHVGADLEETCRLLKEIGFEGVQIYEKRIPTLFTFEEMGI